MIILFGIAKEIVGSATLNWPYDKVSTVGELKVWILENYPAFTNLNSLRIAVNEEYAEDDVQLKASDEIVLIPPVAGG